ncbi:MAG: hypothetical protein ACYCZH_07730 [Sulfuriferula sp.]
MCRLYSLGLNTRSKAAFPLQCVLEFPDRPAQNSIGVIILGTKIGDLDEDFTIHGVTAVGSPIADQKEF